jgi:hypothetical protein
VKKVSILLLLVFFSFWNNSKAQQYTITPITFAPAPNVGISLVGGFGSADDGVSQAIQIGFDFCFYGATYSEVYVGTNGWVSFSAGQPATFTSAPILHHGTVARLVV